MRIRSCLLQATLWFAGTVLAGGINGGHVGNGTLASCTQSALETAIAAGGVVTFDCGGPATIHFTHSLYVDSSMPVTIDGANQITFDGGGTVQLIFIAGAPGSPAPITLRNLTLANGNNSTGLVAGGAIINTGNLKVSNVTFSGNTADGSGGAVFSEECGDCAPAVLNVTNSLFINNHSNGSGGAISAQGDFVTVTNSTFSANTAASAGAIELYTNSDFQVIAVISGNTFVGNKATSSGDGTGGAISSYLFNAGSSATITNNTFYNNAASSTGAGGTGRGGAIYVASGPMTLTNNTIASSSAVHGGGIYVDQGSVSVRNSLLASNPGGNCAGGVAVTNGGNNLQFGDSSCPGVTMANPLLGALADNGGPTFTMALGAGSPAIDAGNNALCPAADQRGAARSDGNADTVVTCDIGAFEAPLNYQGLWWASPPGSESGWGINFAHQGNTLFATWFTYDLAGKPWWLAATATQTAPGVYSGTLFTTTGPPFNAVPFNPANVVETTVGNATFTFASGTSGTFAYTVNGVSQNKTITRQVFGAPVPLCTWGAPADLTAAGNYQDLWWKAPASTESGWGINFTQQGETIFATWFTYDLAGKPWWLAVSALRTGPGIYTGNLFTTTGPAFSAVPFNPANVVETTVGTATFTFTNGNSATFAYTVNGVTQSKPITRQLFSAHGTGCQ